MTQEDKELLIIDLSSRLIHKVKCLCDIYKTFDDGGIIATLSSIDLKKERAEFYNVITPYFFDEIKPYLRPMSSMNEGEISDLQKINSQFCFDTFDNFAYVGAADDGFCSVEEMSNILNYLNSHHFDYRGLIEKGLAIKVTEENNPYT